MTGASLLAYAAALLLAVATPGPAMLAIISRGLSRGSRAALAMASGVALADVLLGGLALLGLAAVLALFGWVFVLMKYAGAAYLVWLGVRMWRSPPPTWSDGAAPAGRSLALGLAVGLGNPKAILFHASLMPLLIDLRLLDGPSAGAILAIILGANLAVMSTYAIVAGQGARWLRTPARLRLMTRLAGGSMIGAGSLIAFR